MAFSITDGASLSTSKSFPSHARLLPLVVVEEYHAAEIVGALVFPAQDEVGSLAIKVFILIEVALLVGNKVSRVFYCFYFRLFFP